MRNHYKLSKSTLSQTKSLPRHQPLVKINLLKEVISTFQLIKLKTKIVDPMIEDITINEVSPLIKTKTYLTAPFIRIQKNVASQEVEVVLCHHLNMIDTKAARITNLLGQTTPVDVEMHVMSIVIDR